MRLYYNKVREEQHNAKYPYMVEINTPEDLEKVVCYDHVCAEYAENYRKNDNFISADCNMFDVDNTDSDDLEKWITPGDVKKAFPCVPFYVSYSRNHMKAKAGKAPRPKFHVYFPDIEYTDMKVYRRCKENVCRYFTAFDPNAKDAARFFFGVEQPKVEFYPGNILLSDFMKDRPTQENQQIGLPLVENRLNIIPEGTRNQTMFRFAEHVLREKGDIEETFQCYMNESKRCSPPLDENELKQIWKSAQKRYRESRERRFTERNIDNSVWDLLNVVDNLAMKELLTREPKNRKFNIAAARLFLNAFGVKVRLNEMNRCTEITGLPPKYCGEDAHNLLVTLISDFMYYESYRRATGPVVYDTLNVIASENRYHPVLELLCTEPWDGKNRWSEIYHMMGISDDFQKTLVRKWALQTIAVLYNSEDNRIAAQGVLVLQGEQGIGKTQFFRHLAIREEFFKGGATLDMSNKDSLMSATKVWICELGEIDSTTKKAQSALKAFLTEQMDRFREPYARAETVRPRRTSFCGTVNPVRYLRDETGNRRYWTIPVKNIDVDMLFNYPSDWYAQFWRQVHEEYRHNPQGYLLTHKEQDKVNQCNSDFEAELPGEDEFMTLFNTEADISNWRWETAAGITKILKEYYKGLNIASETVGKNLIPRLKRRVGKGFKRKKVRGKRLILIPPTFAREEQRDYDNYGSISPISFNGTDDLSYTSDDETEDDVIF